jgi:hypothetical protein
VAGEAAAGVAAEAPVTDADTDLDEPGVAVKEGGKEQIGSARRRQGGGASAGGARRGSRS